MSKWDVGIYLRLSSDDDDDKLESNSITNQRNLINYHLSNLKNINIYKYYADDGYTGTDFNRPAFQEMLNDIYNGRINCVIVKDLSRLGRNYINVGHFIDDTIPRYRLRFISVNDNVDSYKNPDSMDSLEVLFKNLMNESFAKDISKKIRTSFEISKRNGNYIGVVAPFGYLKDPDDCHKFIIDKEAEKIVKKVFSIAMSGKSRQEILEYLNSNHIPTPSKYMKTFCNKKGVCCDEWDYHALDNILRNKTYTGDLIQGKKTRISHKKHNIVNVPEEEWICITNHHKAIISKDVFNQVQDILYGRNSRISNNKKLYKYTGYLKCADCGSSMHKFVRPNSTNKTFFYCGTYHKNKDCTKHYITEKEIDNSLLTIINKFIEVISNLDEKISNNVSLSYIKYEKENKELKLIDLEKEESKYRKLIDELKEDYKNNIISKNDFDKFKDNYMFKLNNVLLIIDELNNSNFNDDNIDKINRIKEYGQLDQIDRNIIYELIDFIKVHEDGSLEVKFKYKNLYEDALRYLNS